LNELIAKGFSDELKNPINTSETCDKYDSYVELLDTNNKKVTLNCGNYYVEGTQGSTYKVYEVSEWHDTKQEGDNENSLLFNYKVNGALALGEYVSTKAFIEWYYVKTNSIITSPYDIDGSNGIEVVTKDVYRTKTLVKEIK
jgi:hypothetical protein